MKGGKRFVTEFMPLTKTFESASALCACKCKIISQIQRNKINRAFCWKPNTKCPAERTRSSLSKTHNPELKSNVSLLYNLQKSKWGRTANQ